MNLIRFRLLPQLSPVYTTNVSVGGARGDECLKRREANGSGRFGRASRGTGLVTEL